MRRAALAIVVLVALTACGSDATSDGGASSDEEPSAATSLTIVVTADEGVAPQTYDLTCDPAGGDHPQPAQACAAIDKAGVDVFSPPPADQACTMIFGGPQTATVEGTYDGAKIDTAFSRANGCEIDRWEQLGTTFFNVPLQ